MPTPPITQPTVIVIDDDPAVRESISGLIRSVGFQVKMLASVDEFHQSGRPSGPACLVLDVRLPGQSGLDLQRELASSRIQVPIVFITGHGDIPMSVQAMKGGAIEFLTKPFRDQDLLDAIQVVAAEIVHNDDVAESEFGSENLFEIGLEHDAVDRAVENHRRDDAGLAQACDQSRRFPVFVRDADPPTLAFPAPIRSGAPCWSRPRSHR